MNVLCQYFVRHELAVRIASAVILGTAVIVQSVRVRLLQDELQQVRATAAANANSMDAHAAYLVDRVVDLESKLAVAKAADKAWAEWRARIVGGAMANAKEAVAHTSVQYRPLGEYGPQYGIPSPYDPIHEAQVRAAERQRIELSPRWSTK